MAASVDPSPVPPRRLWSRVPLLSTKPEPIPVSISPSPEKAAGWWSVLTFGWLTPLMRIGYGRSLENTDLWQMPSDRSANVYAERILTAFEHRRQNTRAPWYKSVFWRVRGSVYYAQRHARWEAKYEPSLALALNDAVFWWFWIGGFFRFIADLGQILAPLLVRALISFANDSYHAPNPPPIGRGVGLAIGLLLLQWTVLLSSSHAYYRMFTTGVILRAGLISVLFGQGLSLSTRGMAKIGSAARLTTLLSADISRIDFACGWFHMAWTGPVQLIACLVILCVNLGWAALPGFALFLAGGPAQGWITGKLFLLRKRSMVWTDKRIKLLTELLGNMHLVKVFAWELPFLARVTEYRHEEMKFLRRRLVLRAVNNALAFSLPTMSAVVSFVVYAAAGNDLDPAIIFSSLSLFNLLRTPLTALPVSLNSIADAKNGIERIRHVLLTDVIQGSVPVDPALNVAIRAKDATFEWEDLSKVVPIAPKPKADVSLVGTVKALWGALKGMRTLKARREERKKGKDDGEEEDNEEGEDEKEKTKEKVLESESGAVTPASSEESKTSVFQMRNVTLDIPRGELWAVVGPVGSGKSSLLQGLLGEMPRVEGTVTFGNKVAYCPQVAWIQSTSIRENITFGQPWNEEKYWKVCGDVCLMADFEMFTDRDMTQVGEKGISLSGGQKQRINIARALYFDAPITLFDDSFSALDAHVGHRVFHNVLLGALAGRTRVLVTHALHFLPHADRVIALERGQIVEQGKYEDLLEAGGKFGEMVKEFGSKGEGQHGEKGGEDGEKEAEEIPELAGGEKKKEGAKPMTTLMQAEERNRGSVTGQTYKEFFEAAKLGIALPLFIIAVIFFQGASVLSPYWLVFWQEDHFPIHQGVYMAVYAVLGFAQAFGLFSMGCVFALFTFNASQTLHRNALKRVLHAPTSFFDTTPLGRIMNRFSKDIDVIDNQIGDAMRMLMGTVVQVIGSIVLVSISLPWFLIAIAVILVLYYWLSIFYTASSREFKRLDAILRSALYAHFSEAMTGVSTIRAYGEAGRFRDENTSKIDDENRAYWLSVTNQRWLSVRLDFLGSLSIFAVAILAVGTRFDISPAETGVVLSYMLVVQQAFGWMVRQSAEVENSMNGVERMLYYANHIEQEASHEIPETAPPKSWPERGEIDARDIVVTYRPELPPVLKGVSMHIRGSEHIGIVGRTGAGKSTITMALFRTIELLSGKIDIDGVDISKIGLRNLRSALAIIPQDPLLFQGTLRSNLDPFGKYDDATLWSALKRSCLVPSESLEMDEKKGEDENRHHLTLDSDIEAGGANLSVGQRSLVSFARALVKDSRIIILDEATASIDYSTDHAIQQTIANEFADRTLLCIAHRLNTIIGYDRILVMDTGEIAEFDAPEMLWMREGSVFRGMCDRSWIGMNDIMRARGARGKELAT